MLSSLLSGYTFACKIMYTGYTCTSLYTASIKCISLYSHVTHTSPDLCNYNYVFAAYTYFQSNAASLYSSSVHTSRAWQHLRAAQH